METLKNWFIQKTKGGHFRLACSDGFRSSNIHVNGEEITQEPFPQIGDVVETKNSQYILGDYLWGSENVPTEKS